jgi:hypothetical protein
MDKLQNLISKKIYILNFFSLPFLVIESTWTFVRFKLLSIGTSYLPFTMSIFFGA